MSGISSPVKTLSDLLDHAILDLVDGFAFVHSRNPPYRRTATSTP